MELLESTESCLFLSEKEDSLSADFKYAERRSNNGMRHLSSCVCFMWGVLFSFSFFSVVCVFRREMFFRGEGEFLSQRTVLTHGSVVEKSETPGQPAEC